MAQNEQVRLVQQRHAQTQPLLAELSRTVQMAALKP